MAEGTTATTTGDVRRLVAFDPGKATGVAEWDADSQEWSAEELDVQGVFRKLDELAVELRPVQLVSESFTITAQTAKNSQASWSLELIGAMRYVVSLFSDAWPPLVLQAPALAKSFATDDKLRLMGWKFRGGAGHADDASRHLLTFCATRSPWAHDVVGQDRLRQMAEL